MDIEFSFRQTILGSDLDNKLIFRSQIGLHHPSFVNRISEAHQTEEPQQFYGGIIADPMGLGKTLAMISLAATDLGNDNDFKMYMDVDGDDKCYVSATLVIIPPPRMS